MKKIINSEYHFTDRVFGDEIFLICYIDYEKKTYNIVQRHQEGLFFSDNNTDVMTNLAYLELAKEALEFVECELYGGAKPIVESHR